MKNVIIPCRPCFFSQGNKNLPVLFYNSFPFPTFALSINGWIIMELINNVNKTLREDLMQQLHSGSRLSVAASCFSIYAFQELKAALKDIKELRFIF
ncbi:MAG: hypothetical protein J6N73_03680, partial [Prevotella sp.]|nr:hypothetical protein [Prevotella sp.]